VDSFDMAIYSNDGKVLWNKTNQAVTAGTATETVSFNGNYTGPITILINNIKSSNKIGYQSKNAGFVTSWRSVKTRKYNNTFSFW